MYMRERIIVVVCVRVCLCVRRLALFDTRQRHQHHYRISTVIIASVIIDARL